MSKQINIFVSQPGYVIFFTHILCLSKKRLTPD